MPENKEQRIQRKQFLDEYKGRPVGNLWTDINVINPMSQERLEFVGQKPEPLIKRVFDLTTNPGDLVLDSFLGSGTTAAVAQKMGRRWIGIEMGDHAYTHCKTRLDKVIDGADAGGVTKSVGWQGGGGYRFYELAPTLILRDVFGEAVISDKYNAEQLAAAVALHEGYTYQPDAEIFWKQAVGTEKSYLFTTTRPITAAYLDAIAAEMQPGEFLTIAATSFPPELAKAEKRITLRQIPEMLLAKCAFGVENYNLPIIDPPRAEKGEEDEIG
ncbi:MAG: site-specific DNA-methyltransferase [Schwartzia sp.]|nr:site-specific DNA-methyltransferase [Schwartzia sp. (in: firmicutes)]